MGASDALEPDLPHRRGFLDQSPSRADGSPVVRFGAEHLLMPLTFVQAELAQDRRLCRIDATALVAARESCTPVDQVEVVFAGDGKEVQ